MAKRRKLDLQTKLGELRVEATRSEKVRDRVVDREPAIERFAGALQHVHQENNFTKLFITKIGALR